MIFSLASGVVVAIGFDCFVVLSHVYMPCSLAMLSKEMNCVLLKNRNDKIEKKFKAVHTALIIKTGTALSEDEYHS